MQNLGRKAPRDRESVSVCFENGISHPSPLRTQGPIIPVDRCDGAMFQQASHTTDTIGGTAYGSLRSQGRRGEMICWLPATRNARRTSRPATPRKTASTYAVSSARQSYCQSRGARPLDHSEESLAGSPLRLDRPFRPPHAGQVGGGGSC